MGIQMLGRRLYSSLRAQFFCPKNYILRVVPRMKKILVTLFALLFFLFVCYGIIGTVQRIFYSHYTLHLGQEQILDTKQQGISFTPDGQVSFITLLSGDKRYFISGSNSTYSFVLPQSQPFS